MQNVVAYCRVSTNKEDQINSFESQKLFFTEYAKKNNLNLVKIYADEGISGTKTKNRTAFNEMMTDSENKEFELVLVKDISRLARNTVDLLQSIRKLKSLDIDTRFITSNMKTLGESEFVLTIFGAMAQEESANMSKRVKFGKNINAERGRVPNICYGYNKIKGELYTLQINEEESEIVKEIYDLYINQNCGQLKIATLLNEKGSTSTRGVKWSQVSVARILKNKIYAGYIINNKSEVKDFLTSTREKKEKKDWIEIENPSLKIIDLDTWNKAQEIREKQTQNFNCITERKSNKFLFSTLIKCEECGYSFRQTNRQYRYKHTIAWSCGGRNHHGVNSCSNNISIEESELVSQINSFLKNIAENKKSFIEKIKKENEKKNSKKDNTIQLSKKLQKLISNKEKQIIMFQDDVITREELKVNVLKINSEIATIESTLNANKKNTPTPVDVNVFLKNVEKILKENVSIESLSNAELKTIINKITVNKDREINIYLNI